MSTKKFIWLTIIAIILIIAWVIGYYFTIKSSKIITPISQNGSKKSELDWKDIISWASTIYLGFTASIIALFQAIFNVIQRSIDLRWKQAELARQLVDDLYEEETSYDALRMLETVKKNYSNFGNISPDEVKSALKNTVFSEKEAYIRSCFDALFFHLERIANSIEIRVIKFQDIKSHLTFYAHLILNFDASVLEYCREINYDKVYKFIERFKEN